MKRKSVNRFNIRFKEDYTKIEPRQRLNTTLRESAYNDIFELSELINEPVSKMLDILISEKFESQEALQEFVDKLRNY